MTQGHYFEIIYSQFSKCLLILYNSADYSLALYRIFYFFCGSKRMGNSDTAHWCNGEPVEKKFVEVILFLSCYCFVLLVKLLVICEILIWWPNLNAEI